MRNLLIFYSVFFLWVVCSNVARAEGDSQNQCPVKTEQRKNAFEFGLNIQTVLPNRLPDFDIGLPVYGPIIGVPFFGDVIQLQAFYGALAGLSLYTLEANYRFNIPMPYFTPFFMVGVHYLSYTFTGNNRHHSGPNFGTGLSFDMSNDFDINLMLKAYVQERALFAFGGGFSFLF